MAATERAPLVGTWGRVWLDGKEFAKVSSITAELTNNYQDYYQGQDVRRVKVSQSGTGSLTIQSVVSDCADLLKKYKDRGEEPHFTIETNLNDPGALNQQQEGYTLNEVSFDSVPFLGFEKGNVVTKDLSFAFPGSKVQVNAQVFDED